jgi:hypothetical protein
MEHRDLSMYIVLQDGTTKLGTPRSIAYETATGGIKICSEKSVHVIVKIANFMSSFETNFISGNGIVVDKNNIKFGGGVTPNLNQVTNECKFSFNLKKKSQTDRCFYCLVFSWITNENKIGFLVSSPFAAYTQNTIYNQNIFICSYLSSNYCESELLTDKLKSKTKQLEDYVSLIMDYVRNGIDGLHRSYIIHQNYPFTLANSMTAVLHAIIDLNNPRSDFNTLTRTPCGTEETYSRVDSLSQKLKIIPKNDTKNIKEEHYLETAFIENMTHPLPIVNLRFATCIARSIGQLKKGTKM